VAPALVRRDEDDDSNECRHLAESDPEEPPSAIRGREAVVAARVEWQLDATGHDEAGDSENDD
jgi:hypothetical protein